MGTVDAHLTVCRQHAHSKDLKSIASLDNRKQKEYLISSGDEPQYPRSQRRRQQKEIGKKMRQKADYYDSYNAMEAEGRESLKKIIS